MINQTQTSITEDVLNNYPLPISYEYARLIELQNLSSSISILCEQLRTVIWFASRYLAIVTVSSYLRTNHADLHFAPFDREDMLIEKEIKDKRNAIFSHLSNILQLQNKSPYLSEKDQELNHWLDLTFEIVDFWQSTYSMPFIKELVDLASSYHEPARTLSYYYSYYQEITPRSDKNLTDYYNGAFNSLLEFLREISFIKGYQLVRVIESERVYLNNQNAKFTWIFRQFMGQAMVGFRKSLDASNQCPNDNLHILALLAIDSPNYIRLLPLLPLSIFTLEDRDAPLENPEIALINDRHLDNLRYRLASQKGSTNPRYVTLNDYVDLLNDLLARSLEIKFGTLSEHANWEELKQHISQNNAKVRKRIGEQKYSENHYVERAKINIEVEKFLNSESKGLLIVGDAGVGKTNLLCHLSILLQRKTNLLALLFDCRDFHTVDIDWKNIEHRLLGLIGWQGENSLLSALKKIENININESSVQFVLLLDALNEHSEADRLIRLFSSHFLSDVTPEWFKIVVTCRTEPWERSLKYLSGGGWYQLEEGGNPVEMVPFSADEVENAYNNKYELKPEFSTLPSLLKKLFSDPLMLGLTYRIYGQKPLPKNLHQSRIFREYIHTMIPDFNDVERAVSREAVFLKTLLKLMYENNISEVPLAKLYANPLLQEAFSSHKMLPNNPYLQLISDLLRYSDSHNSITFRYERVFEFALAEFILKDEAIKHNWSISWFGSKVSQSTTFPNLWGALRYLLSDYLGYAQRLNYEFIRILASHEQYEVRKLLIETLVELAARDDLETIVFDTISHLLEVDDANGKLINALMGEVSIIVARRMRWANILEKGVKSPLITVRTASVQAIYYIWQQDRNEGVTLLNQIASLVKAEILKSSPNWLVYFIRSKLSLRKTTPPSQSSTSLPLTTSFISLTMIMVAHCLRNPETVNDLYKVWNPIFNTIDKIPNLFKYIIEFFMRRIGANVMKNAWGDDKDSFSASSRDKQRAISGRTFKAFVDLPLEHDYRRKIIKYLKECNPEKGRLTPILDEVIELAKIPDALVHFVPQILFLTRGHQSAEDVLEICQRLCDSDDLYHRYEGITKMGVYLYSVPEPPLSHMKFIEDQISWLWQGSLKFFELAGESYLVDQLRYPIMYECSQVGKNRTQGQIDFVHKIRALPWEDNVVDRDILLIRNLAEAAVFGHIVYDIHVIPILETLQIWFDPQFYSTPNPRGDYLNVSISEAVAKALSRIQTIFPDETERYLSFASPEIRRLTAKEQEESAASTLFTAGQSALAWAFLRPGFRNTWISGISRVAKEATSLEQGFQIMAEESFTFDFLKAFLAE